MNKIELEHMIFNALRNGDEICEHRKYKCPEELTCDECVQSYIDSFKESIRNEKES